METPAAPVEEAAPVEADAPAEEAPVKKPAAKKAPAKAAEAERGRSPRQEACRQEGAREDRSEGRRVMAGETIITVVGNLTADPELRYTQNGLAVANFTIASTPRNFDRATNDWKDGEALFLRASVWREFAEHVAGSLTKGSRVIATGRLKQRSYETKEGEKRTSIELEVDEIGPSLRYATAQVTRAASTRDSERRWRRPPRGRGGRAVGGSRPGRGFRRVEHAGQLQRRDPLLSSPATL